MDYDRFPLKRDGMPYTTNKKGGNGQAYLNQRWANFFPCSGMMKWRCKGGVVRNTRLHLCTFSSSSLNSSSSANGESNTCCWWIYAVNNGRACRPNVFAQIKLVQAPSRWCLVSRSGSSIALRSAGEILSRLLSSPSMKVLIPFQPSEVNNFTVVLPRRPIGSTVSYPTQLWCPG